MDLSPHPTTPSASLKSLWNDSVTDLTCGFIHDLNNALVGVASTADLILLEFEAEHPQYHNLKNIQESARRAAALIDRFGRLLQNKFGERNYHDARTLLNDTVGFLRPAIPRRIELRCQPGDASLPVCLDAQALRAVLCSLTFHAAGALPGKGRLEWDVRLEHDPSPPGKDTANACVVFTLRASGPGMSPGALEPGLEPAVSPGRDPVALTPGFPQSVRIARQHLGATVTSARLDDGTALKLRFPRSDFTELDR
jgi:signal transduction histidine kinase